jgi:uncharacterized protein YukJ
MSHGHGHHPQPEPGPTGTAKQTYGFVKCKIAGNIHPKPTQLRSEVQYHLHADLIVAGSHSNWDTAVNVGTTDADDLLNYRLVADFHHPIIDTLKAAAAGFHNLTGKHQFPALDFLRTDILKETGGWRQSDSMHDLHTAKPYIDLKGLFDRAKKEQADVYIFGRTYTHDGDGIHDIHMNQGSRSPHLHADKDGNDVFQDGAVLFDFSTPQWIAYFTTFTQQNVPTNGVGDPTPGSHPINNHDPGSMAGH